MPSAGCSTQGCKPTRAPRNARLFSSTHLLLQVSGGMPRCERSRLCASTIAWTSGHTLPWPGVVALEVRLLLVSGGGTWSTCAHSAFQESFNRLF